jgi:hypothetical protein
VLWFFDVFQITCRRGMRHATPKFNCGRLEPNATFSCRHNPPCSILNGSKCHLSRQQLYCRRSFQSGRATGFTGILGDICVSRRSFSKCCMGLTPLAVWLCDCMILCVRLSARAKQELKTRLSGCAPSTVGTYRIFTAERKGSRISVIHRICIWMFQLARELVGQ